MQCGVTYMCVEERINSWTPLLDALLLLVELKWLNHRRP